MQAKYNRNYRSLDVWGQPLIRTESGNRELDFGQPLNPQPVLISGTVRWGKST